MAPRPSFNYQSGAPRRAGDTNSTDTARSLQPELVFPPSVHGLASPSEAWRVGLQYSTHSGVLVRSKIEKIIADFFTDQRIPFNYEPVVYCDGSRYRPDFYLPQYAVYYEHFGRDDAEYRKAAAAKLRAYRRAGLPFIYTTVQDEPEIEDAIVDRLAIATLQ